MRWRSLGGSVCVLRAAFLLNGGLALSCAAGTSQLVSAIDSTGMPSATGNGDSVAPLLSTDGRYVLFASTANNLVLNSNGNPLPGTFPARLNVFRRDRTNGSTSLVSVNSNGTDGGNGDSLPAGISADGRFALFESRASDLVAADTNQTADIFLRDMWSNRTVLVSVSTNGSVGNGDCRSPVMTPDARFVAFVSAANNLVPNDTNGIADVFVRDLQSNVTLLISPDANASPAPGVTASEAPLITPDGRYVAFSSTATNLVASVGGGPHIYVRDLSLGATTWASTAASNLVGSNAFCFSHAISTDGQFIAFEVSSRSRTGGVVARYNLQTGVTDVVHTNGAIATAAYADIRSLDMTPDGRFIAFVANTNTASTTNTCILVWDGQLGNLVLASADLSGGVPPASICDWPAINPGGRYVAFLSSGTNLVTNNLAGDYHLYLRDLQSGALALLDMDTNGVGSGVGPGTTPRLSADGTLVGFEAWDGNLVAYDRNHSLDVFLRDLNASHTELISARDSTLPSQSANGHSALYPGSISANGRYVAFCSYAGNLVANDANGCPEVFVRDRVAGTNMLASAATNGLPANLASVEPGLSADGRYVAFTSAADNLVPGDTNRARDVFVRDLQTGTTSLASISTNGVNSGNRYSYSPILSADGRSLLFLSAATDLAPVSSGLNLFWRDLQSGTTYAVTTNGVSYSAMTSDGHYVAYSGTGAMRVWDSQLKSVVYTNTSAFSPASISPDGRRILSFQSSFRVLDWVANTNWVIASSPTIGSHPGLRFSADSRFMTYATFASQVSGDTNNNFDVYLYDFQTLTNTRITHSFSGGSANGPSDSPDISADGRFIAYRSAATNIVPGAANGFANVFLYDRVSGTTTLLSSSLHGPQSADNFSLTPLFSGDGTMLFFQSWGSDLVTNDFNGSSDVFAYTPNHSSSPPVFSATIANESVSGSAIWISWPVQPGTNYRLQFKNNLSDSQWQDLGGNVEVVGTQAFLRDPVASGAQRFYRIVAN